MNRKARKWWIVCGALLLLMSAGFLALQTGTDPLERHIAKIAAENGMEPLPLDELTPIESAGARGRVVAFTSSDTVSVVDAIQSAPPAKISRASATWYDTLQVQEWRFYFGNEATVLVANAPDGTGKRRTTIVLSREPKPLLQRLRELLRI